MYEGCDKKGAVATPHSMQEEKTEQSHWNIIKTYRRNRKRTNQKRSGGLQAGSNSVPDETVHASASKSSNAC